MNQTRPYIHALLAESYIVLVVLVLFLGTRLVDIPETPIIPITFLSVLVLSVATMAYLFFFVPFLLFLGGEREKAIQFFVRTIASFALITVCALILLYASSLFI